MPINRLPGVYYDENVSYELSGIGGKIPIFIGVTGNTDHYKFISYNNDGTTKYGEGTVKLTGTVKGDYSEVEVLTNNPDNSFVGNKYYIKSDAVSDDTLYDLYSDAGVTSANIKVKITETYKTDGSTYQTYTKWSEVNQDISLGGIGRYMDDEGEVLDENNILGRVISEFYSEARLLTREDVGVHHIYVIDLGTGTDYNKWIKSIATAKKLLDAQVEVYVGAKIIPEINPDGSQGENDEIVICQTPAQIDANGNIISGSKPVNKLLTTFLSKVYNREEISTTDDYDYGLEGSAKNLDLRYAFTTVFDKNGEHYKVNDDHLISLTSNNNFHESRVGICEPLLFGKTIARICCTPANTEPGYYAYRSVTEGTFIPRTKKQMLELQNNGIIFNRDEHINGTVYCKMNLCVATSFCENPRPADSLFHARFNADDLLREVFEACYDYIKANETASNLAYLQTRINKLVNDRIVAEEMVKYNETTGEGTRLRVSVSDSDEYSLEVSGQIQPVKHVNAIDVTATLKI